MVLEGVGGVVEGVFAQKSPLQHVQRALASSPTWQNAHYGVASTED